MKEEVENLSEADKKLCRMLGALEKMEAPKDFDFHLKARIANADPKAYHPGFVRRYAYVMSVSTLAVALIVAGFYGNFSGTAETTTAGTANTESNIAVQPQPSLSESPQVAVATPLQTESNTLAANVQVPLPQKVPSVPPVVAFNDTNTEQKFAPRNTKNSNSQRSKDEAVTPPKVFTPRGLDPESKNTPPENLTKNEDFSARELFNTLGAETYLEKGVLKVKSVQPNSPAAKSGLKADDVIDTLNGQKVSGRGIRATKVEVKKIGVVRGAETVEIDLQTKPQQ